MAGLMTSLHQIDVSAALVIKLLLKIFDELQKMSNEEAENARYSTSFGM